MNKLEKLIAGISPNWAASRSRSRREQLQNDLAMSHLRKYEAASKGRRNSHVKATGSDANSEIGSSASISRNYARQIVRDNPMGAAALNVIANNTIGKGIAPEISARTKTIQREAEVSWRAYAGTTQIDIDGDLTFAGLQNLVMRTIPEAGSCLIRRVRAPSSARLAVPFQIQVLEPDYLDVTKDGADASGKTVRGKKYDSEGRLLGYHLYRHHPGSQRAWLSMDSVFVDAADIIHIFRKDRPGQVDGITWFAPCMNLMRDLMETRDAYQLRQKISACFAAFVHDADAQGGGGFGGGNPEPLVSHIEPGRISTLPPGKEITFADPPGVDGLVDFDRIQQISIATGLGIPYEAFGDLRNVSFLSGRMGWLAFYKNIDSWRQNMIIPQLCDGVFRWFAEAMEINFVLKGMQNPGLFAEWTAPDRDLLDPAKELGALRDEHRLGALPFGELVRARGRDPEKVLESYKKWNRLFDDAGLVFDGDPRRVSRAGNTNAKNPAEDENADDDEGSGQE